ncbi:unnamed protein product [Fraxinus pennsylvanica]|uniref:Myb-like domain-containing protein n=1 Tax=Fraxinus pennsylvanica TaxID=56036 RepID=A0AAD2A3R9_9LAMI|nr:unnamed protein product [Fraxinus pennsylvanica]
MLGVSGIINSSGEGAGAPPEGHESGGASGGSSDVGGGATSIPGGFSEEDKAAGSRMEESERSVGGNRWPRQETMALIKIRSDMAVAFRDSSLKGPLWEDVSRKMAELGFERTAKKCKEKFENLYKYHKRTKEGRAAKQDGKTYRFFDQLEALENSTPQPVLARPQPLSMVAPPPMLPVSISGPNAVIVAQNAAAAAQGANNSTSSLFQQFQPPQLQQAQPPPTMNTTSTTTLYPSQSRSFQPSNVIFSNSSSSTSSDEDIQRRRGRKRKWKDFFERLMKDVIDKQEELQKKFLETLDKRERDRMAKEEAWRVQEMTRLNREHDLLVQERSISAAKDAAVIQFFQKITEQQSLQIPISNANTPQMPISMPMPMQVQAPANTMPPVQPPQPAAPLQQTPAPAPAPESAPPPAPTVEHVIVTPTNVLDTPRTDSNGGENFIPMSSSRWPKAEVQALIDLRTSLDLKYQENGPKGPLWEEISAAMARLGYNRNAKRCKEKWENINKYFKKVKESSKKRPEDSKTCPYFHQLDALYRERAKTDSSHNPGFLLKLDQNPMVPIMARPEQQYWPLPQGQHQDSALDDHGCENVDENDDHKDDDEDEDDEDEDEGASYEIVTNKQQSSTTNTNTNTIE